MIVMVCQVIGAGRTVILPFFRHAIKKIVGVIPPAGHTHISPPLNENQLAFFQISHGDIAGQAKQGNPRITSLEGMLSVP
jgi:hypothetical protein